MHTHSAIEIRDQFIRGETSATAIVQHFLNRIVEHDGLIGAFLRTLPERALTKAESLDKKRASGKPLGKLAGIPIAIKDNILVEGDLTTCASRFLRNFKAPYNATAIHLLEEEDAIIIGKTNMDEFAMGSSTENSALQKTVNPWNLNCTPGGSSGGSAAAVAARLCPMALGSDTGGSVRQPAAFCGIVGFKPTYGRVSRSGLVAFGSSLDQIGPMTSCTADTALLMEVLGRHCEKDSTSIPQGPQEYLTKMNGNIKGMKIGVPWEFLEGLSSGTKQMFMKGLEVLKSLGAEVVDIDLSILKYSIPVYYILATAEASTNLARFDGIRYGERSPQAHTLDEVYDLSKEEGFGHEVKRRILLGTYVLSAGYQDAYYKKAQKVRTLIIASYNAALQKCDLIATPVAPSPAFEYGTIKDPLQMYLEDIYTLGANLGGVPAISVPAGFDQDGKPFGLQLTGAQMKDVDVVRAAYAFEKATNYHTAVPPLFR